MVIPNEEKIYKDIDPYSLPMGTAQMMVCEEFTDAELAVVERFISKANTAANEVITQTRGEK